MTRTKYVHSEDMVAHLWAHQTQEHARSGQGPSGRPRMFFGGLNERAHRVGENSPRLLYSYGYHFVAAAICEAANGDKIALINEHEYSVTTRKHLASIRSAVRGVMPYFEVLDPRADSKEAHKRNVAHMDAEIIGGIAEFMKRRGGKESHASYDFIVRAVERRNLYASTFRLGLKTFSKWDVGAIEAKAATLRLAARSRAENEQKREYAKRAALRDKILAQISENEDIAAVLTEEGLARFHMAWRKGELDSRVNVPLVTWAVENAVAEGHEMTPPPEAHFSYMGPVMLRRDGEECVTTRGARVPLDHARRIFKMWERLQGRVPPEGWENKGDSQEGRVGHFRVDRIAPDGTLTAGCHTILPGEIRAFGQAMGWGD